MTETCDNCGASIKYGDSRSWWISKNQEDSDAKFKMFFCSRCYARICEADKEYDYTIECNLCGALAHPYPTDRNMVRLKPGVFVCADTEECKKVEVTPPEKAQVIAFEKAKSKRKAIWKPRPISW